LKFWIEYLLEPIEDSSAEICEESGGVWDIEHNRCDRGLPPLPPLVDEELQVEENPAPVVEPLDDVNLSDLAGTYVGTTNFLGHRVENWGGGTITQNEITITISEDGTINGIFSVRFESSQKSNEHCAWQSLQTDSGTIFGQISQSGGTIKFDYTSTLELIREDISGLCALDENATTVTDHHDEFHITISGNTMTGSGDGSKTFEATKQ